MRCQVLALVAIFLAASTGGAAAIDCAKAKSGIEKAICADPAVKAADDAMAATYQDMLGRLDASAAAMLKDNQLQWLKLREDRCSGTAADALSRCLIAVSEERARYLSGMPQSGPGITPSPMPATLSRAESKTQCGAEVATYVFPQDGAPGLAVFNQAIDALSKNLEAEYGARMAEEEGFEYHCYYALDTHFTFTSPVLIAAANDISMYTGGAHGMYSSQSLIIDVAKGRTLVFGDVFPEAAQGPIAAMCSASLLEEKRARLGGMGMSDAEIVTEMAGYDETVGKAVPDFSRWMIYADRAEIYFGPYELGSYAEGPYTCTIPAAELAKLATSGSWIAE
ncbi:MAG: DUF1311 domain-containing protein [Alphaproteobacteria bacterium]|nr:DUF1311 domain-containing protein [Alphaproteobacteria bacterium]